MADDPRVSIEILRKEIEIEKQRQKLLDTSVEKLQSSFIIKQKEIELQERSLALKEDELKLKEKISVQDIKEIEGLNKKIEKEKEKLKIQAKASDAAMSMFDKTTIGIRNLTGISDAWKDTFLGGLIESTKAAGGLSAALANVGKSIKKSITPANVFGSIMMRVQEQTTKAVMTFDSALASFNAATGAAGKYNSALIDIAHSSGVVGISVDDAAESTRALSNRFMEFTSMSADSQKQLIKTFSTWKQFGVSVEDAASNLQMLTKMSNLTIAEANNAQMEIASAAQQLGFDIGGMVGEFSKASTRLGMYGGNMKRVFIDLMVYSKKTGIEIGKLIDITDKMTTFEGVTNIAGYVNAMFRGNILDPLTLLRKEGAEKLIYIKERFDEAGISFENLGIHLKRGLSNNLGMDVKDLAGQMKQTTAKIKENALSLNDQKEAAEKSQAIYEKFNKALEKFAILLEPIIEWAAKALNWFNGIAASLGKWFIPAVLALGVGIGALVMILPLFAAKLAIVAVGGTAAAGALGGVALSILAIGAAIALAAVGLSFLVNSLGNVFGSGNINTGIAGFMKNVDKITPKAELSTKIMTDQAVKFQEANSQASNTNTLNGLTAAVQGLANGTKRPIVLELGGRTLKKFVVDVLKDETNPRKL